MDPTEGVLLIGKNWENGPVGEGYKPSFAGVVTLLRPGTGALRGLGMDAGSWRNAWPVANGLRVEGGRTVGCGRDDRGE